MPFYVLLCFSVPPLPSLSFYALLCLSVLCPVLFCALLCFLCRLCPSVLFYAFFAIYAHLYLSVPPWHSLQSMLVCALLCLLCLLCILFSSVPSLQSMPICALPFRSVPFWAFLCHRLPKLKMVFWLRREPRCLADTQCRLGKMHISK